MYDRNEYHQHAPKELPSWMREGYASRAPKQGSWLDHWAVDLIIFVLIGFFVLYPVLAYNLCWEPYGTQNGAVECRE